MHDIAVLGAGASGLAATIAAARQGASVCLLERNDRVGRKILATGNGRCNLANKDVDLAYFHGRDKGFVGAVLEAVDLNQVLMFFMSLGLDTVAEDGRLYPRSMQAAAVLDVLRHEVERLKVSVMQEARVERIIQSGDAFEIYSSGKPRIRSRRVILATGGKAAPKLGTTGDGYSLATALGHRIIDPVPALVGLRLDSPHLKGLAGVRIAAVCRIPDLGLEQAGEVLFADYGISGIPIFDLSAGASQALRQGLAMQLSLSIMEGEFPQVFERLAERFSLLGHKSSLDALIGLLPKQLGPALLKDAGFTSLHKPAKDATKAELKELAALLCEWRFPIRSHNGWDQAQTTAGGVDLSEVSPSDMQSRIIPGLYFAGEVLDVHGDCGGHNLMWAWSSGILAGTKAASEARRSSTHL